MISRGLTFECAEVPAAVSGSSPSESAPASIHMRIRSILSSPSFAPPWGIEPDAIFCNSRLAPGSLGTMAGPPFPPARIASRVCRSSSAC